LYGFFDCKHARGYSKIFVAETKGLYLQNKNIDYKRNVFAMETVNHILNQLKTSENEFPTAEIPVKKVRLSEFIHESTKLGLTQQKRSVIIT